MQAERGVYIPAQQGGGGDAEDYLPVGSSSIGDCSLCWR